MANIAVLCCPVIGHINPCLTMINLLIPHGFTFTFIVTEELAATLSNPSPSFLPNPSEPQQEGDLLDLLGETSPPITYVSIPSISFDEAVQRSDATSLLSPLIEIMRSMRPGFEGLLRSSSPSSLGSISCIIADSFVSWATEVALQFQVPIFTMFTTNSHAMSAIFHIDELIASGASPMSDPQQIVDFIPGLLPLRAADLPQSVLMHPSFAVELKKNMSQGAGTILNTVYELERKALDAISQRIPVYPIGPMLLMSNPLQTTIVRDTIALWAEDRECLGWLDTALPSSVLFVSFGSLANMSVYQLKEIAEGLEASEQPFLWVIRSNAVEGHMWSSVLPEGFMERTKGRGLIISWAPQLEVLSHPSVGGFLTHCGWNSITENLSTGCVPMLCWPQIAEQRLNARLLVDEWRVGLEFEMGDGNIVKASTIARAIIELMQGDTGKEIKKRTLALKEVVSQSVQEGGSSHRYRRTLVEDLKKTCHIFRVKTDIEREELGDLV